jgi:PDZ domain
VAEPETNPIRGPKLTPRYLATLMVAAVLILVVGSALRPRKPSADTTPPLSQTEVGRLQRLAERQALETTSNHFATIAADVATRIVQVGRTSTTAIVWSAELVVAPGQVGPAPEATTVVTASGEELAASRAAGGPDLPLSGYQVAGQLEPALRRDIGAPELASGQWLIAVWRGSSGPVFAPGHFVETRATRCGSLVARELATTLELAAPMAGAGLFDLDGALVAVVLPCDGAYAALSLESVTLGLVQGRSFDARVEALYGLRLRSLDETLRRHLGVQAGALVSDVWTGYPGERAGLRPGDVIVSAEGQLITAPEDLQPLLAPTERVETLLGVWRGRQRREIRLPRPASQAAASPTPDSPGVGLHPAADGYAIGEVDDGSPAAEAGIRVGDRLLRVDFAVPRTAAEARRALAGRGDLPVFVEVESGRKRFGALLRSP